MSVGAISESTAPIPATASGDLSAQASIAESLADEALSVAAVFRRLGENYGQAHVGPYITVIAAALVELGDACDRLAAGCRSAAEAFRSAASGIDRIGRDAESALSGPDREVGLDPGDLASLQAAELAVLHGLARDLDLVVLGASPELDTDQLLEATSLFCRATGGADQWWNWSLSEGFGPRLRPPDDLDGAGPVFVAAALDEARKRNTSVDFVLDRVVDAMAQGQTPAQAGLSPLLFPPEYWRAATAEEAGASGTAIDGSLGSMLNRPEQLSVYDAVIDVYGLSGDEQWAGRRLAAHLQGDAWKRYLPDPRPYSAIDQFSDDLVADDALAVSFFNHLGPRSTGLLGSLIPSQKTELNDRAKGTEAAMRDVAAALGTAVSSGRLEFSGADVVNASGPPFYAAKLIAASSTASDDFLFDSTVAVLNYHVEPSSRPPQWSQEPPIVQLALRLADQNLPLAFSALAAADDPGKALRVGDSAEWGDLLVSLTLPGVTGDPDLSNEAAVWLVDAAGREDGYRLKPEQARAVEQVIFTRPTMLVQGPTAGDHLAAAGLDATNTYRSLGRSVIDQALRKIFKAGKGDYLRMLQDNIVPMITNSALATGLYPPSATNAFGSIEGTIAAAQLVLDIEHARATDARNALYRSLLDSTIGAGLGVATAGVKLAPVFVEGFVSDQAVGQAVDLLPMLPTGNELGLYRDLYQDELDHELASTMQLVATLADAGILKIVDASEEEGYRSFGRSELLAYVGWPGGNPKWTDLLVADPDGQLVPKFLADGSGVEVLTVKDWIDALQGYDTGRSTELAAAHREVQG